MQLNKAQQTAVTHPGGPMLVLAGPGSGKTTVIVRRVATLIREHHVSPEEILVVTFSRAAADEMRHRFLQDAGAYPVSFGTMHSIFLKILRESGGFGECRILSEGQKQAFLITELGREIADAEERPDLIRRISDEISQVKNHDIDIGSYPSVSVRPALFRRIFDRYREYIKENEVLDFDDILLRCLQLFTDSPAVRKKWQERFRYILVDEFQDINPVQYEILRLLSIKHRNLFVVGDDDQAIYGFRGASPALMKRFLKDFPESRKVLLNVNYRCCKEILNKALQVISVNRSRIPKKILPAGPSASFSGKSLSREEPELLSKKAGEKEKAFQINAFPTRREEFEMIAEKILWLHKRGIPFEEIAILLRNSFDSSLLTQKLCLKNIPYCIKETPTDIFASFIAADMIAYMKIASFSGNRNDFLRIMNRPLRYLSRDAVAEIRMTNINSCKGSPAAENAGIRPKEFLASLKNYYRHQSKMQQRLSQLEEDLSFLADCPPFTAIKYIRNAIGYDGFLLRLAEDQHVPPDSYRNLLDEIEESAKGFTTCSQWFSFIDRYRQECKYRLTDNRSGNRQTRENGVQIMTMHASKGLEFDAVFLPCLNRGVIPHKKALSKEEIEEERRLLYVAMTRAGNHLFMSWSETVRNKPAGPSPFLESIF